MFLNFQAILKPKGHLMSRANSLKKAVRQIIEHTEKGKKDFASLRMNFYGYSFLFYLLMFCQILLHSGFLQDLKKS